MTLAPQVHHRDDEAHQRRLHAALTAGAGAGRGGGRARARLALELAATEREPIVAIADASGNHFQARAKLNAGTIISLVSVFSLRLLLVLF